MGKSPKPPRTLSAEARGWWARLQREYAIIDAAGLLLLSTALEAFDRMREAQGAMKAHGPFVTDRFGQPKPHPGIVAERDSRAAMLAALKALNLDVEPLHDGPGRPPGSSMHGV